MVTILKFPVYIQVHTESLDRANVSKVCRETLYPHLLEYIAKANIRTNVLKNISEQIHGPVDISFLTEVDLIKRSLSNDAPLTIKLIEP